MKRTLCRLIYIVLCISAGLVDAAPPVKIRVRPRRQAGKLSRTRRSQRAPVAPNLAGPTLEVPALKKEVEQSSVSYFYELNRWIEKNKFCLSGSACPLWMSYAAHYALGTAISIGLDLLLAKTGQTYWQALKEVGIAKPGSDEYKGQSDIRKGVSKLAGITQRQAIVAPMIGMYTLAVKLGYKKILSSRTTSMLLNPFLMITGKSGFPEAMRCLLLGQGCDVNQRRRAFFQAGMLTGSTAHMLAKYILNRLSRGIARKVLPRWDDYSWIVRGF